MKNRGYNENFRPSENHHNHRIEKNVSLTEFHIKKVQFFAEKNRMNFSQMVRQMINHYMEE